MHGLAQHAGERRPCAHQRLAPQVLTIEFQQVKGNEKDHSRVVPTVPEQIKPRHPPLVAAHRLAVDQAGLRTLQAVHGLDQSG